jgi:hypothetical protein
MKIKNRNYNLYCRKLKLKTLKIIKIKKYFLIEFLFYKNSFYL